MCAHRPAVAREKDARVRQLFPNCPQVERDYYRKHGVFHLMHTLVLRQSIFEKDKSIARRIHLILEELKTEFYAKIDCVQTPSGFPLARRLHRRGQTIVWGRDPGPTALLKIPKR